MSEAWSGQRTKLYSLLMEGWKLQETVPLDNLTYLQSLIDLPLACSATIRCVLSAKCWLGSDFQIPNNAHCHMTSHVHVLCMH